MFSLGRPFEHFEMLNQKGDLSGMGSHLAPVDWGQA